jgi:murein DD-endopeptidase MepM/ murein hydrolase activator NlpD
MGNPSARHLLTAIALSLTSYGIADAEEATFTVAVRGPGRVMSTPAGIDCPSRCSVTLPTGSAISLTATPGREATFRGWRGACVGTHGCRVELEGTRVVLASFAEREPPHPSPPNATCGSCSLADRAAQAQAHVDPLAAAVERARRRFGDDETRPMVGRLLDGTAEIRAAAARIAAGEVCEGARSATAGAMALQTSREAIAAPPRRLVEARAAPRGRYGDADARDLLAIQHRHRQNLAARVHYAAEEARATFARLCDGVERRTTLKGRISRVEPGTRRVHLADGKVVVLARKLFRAPVYERADVALDTLHFTDGSDLAVEVSRWEPPVFAQAACLKLRLAPFQEFPFNAGALDPSIVLHDPAGYKSGGTHWLEEGMRLALVQVCKPHVSTGHRYFAQLDLVYQRLDGNGSVAASETLATSMSGAHTPVELPGSIDPDADATLTVTVYRTTCTKRLVGVPPHQHMIQDCTQLVQTGATTFELRVRPRASYAAATYDTTLFALEDVYSTSEFAPARVTSVATNSPVSGAHDPVFEARGYRVTGGASSRPAVQPIALDQEFAVYHDDPFFSVNSQVSATGVDHGAGLRWPRIKGNRSGKPFWYSVQLPALVRDVVSFCDNAPDSYYRLPWAYGTLASVPQGNLGSFTHTAGSWNAFAFDLVMPNLTPIYAARGGVVSEVDESNSINDDPNDPLDATGDANFLQVDHDDGTSSYYLHMVKDGVLVAPDQRIRRGQQVAVVGNTGFSTDPHLHFQVGSDAASILVRFEALSPPNVVACITPPGGSALVSSNAEQ